MTMPRTVETTLVNLFLAALFLLLFWKPRLILISRRQKLLVPRKYWLVWAYLGAGVMFLARGLMEPFRPGGLDGFVTLFASMVYGYYLIFAALRTEVLFEVFAWEPTPARKRAAFFVCLGGAALALSYGVLRSGGAVGP
jgi:hypothetical protein